MVSKGKTTFISKNNSALYLCTSTQPTKFCINQNVWSRFFLLPTPCTDDRTGRLYSPLTLFSNQEIGDKKSLESSIKNPVKLK